MGRLLQVRLSAYTYDIEDVRKAWPSLCQTVWPDDKAIKALRISDIAGGRGVLDLVKALEVALEYEPWPDAVKQVLSPLIKSARRKTDELSAALADWNSKAANRATDELEAVLDELEQLNSKIS